MSKIPVIIDSRENPASFAGGELRRDKKMAVLEAMKALLPGLEKWNSVFMPYNLVKRRLELK